MGVEENTRRVGYTAFIYEHQFSRKIGIGKYMLSFRALTLTGLALALFYYSSLEDVDYADYTRFGAFALLAFVLKSYLSLRTRYNSKLGMIEKNGWGDAKSKSIMVLSKISWANKNNYLSKKKEEEKQKEQNEKE